MNLSVVLSARNDAHLPNALRSIEKLKELDAEIVVVEWQPPKNLPSIADLSSGITVIRTERPGEYVAKNIGIRAATRGFILITNADILLSDAMIQRLKTYKLQTNEFYRANRHDMDANGIVTAIHENTTGNEILHTNAAGDFLLMHRDAWFDLHGFPELPSVDMIDAYMVHLAHLAGMKQVIFEEPIYHQHHTRKPGSIGWRPDLIGWKNSGAWGQP